MKTETRRRSLAFGVACAAIVAASAGCSSSSSSTPTATTSTPVSSPTAVTSATSTAASSSTKPSAADCTIITNISSGVITTLEPLESESPSKAAATLKAYLAKLSTQQAQLTSPAGKAAVASFVTALEKASNETAVELLEHATVVGSLCRYLAVHLGLPHDELFGSSDRCLPASCVPHHREEHRRHERHLEELAPELDPLEGVGEDRRARGDEDRSEHERRHVRLPDAEAVQERQADPDEVERNRLPARPHDHRREVRRGEREPRDFDGVLTQPVDSPHGEQSRSGPPARASSAAA